MDVYAPDLRELLFSSLTAFMFVPKDVAKQRATTLYIAEFCCYGSMTRDEQRHKILKAKVVLALYSEYGCVPKEEEIDEVYHLSRIL